MSSTIFNNLNKLTQMQSQSPSPIRSAMQAINAMRGGNPENMMHLLMNSNPQFKQFVEQNKGKSVEQIATQYGLNLEDVKALRG